MKRKKLEKILRKYNWELARHGSNHDIWTNGNVSEAIPRHSEISEFLAKKKAKAGGRVWN